MFLFHHLYLTLCFLFTLNFQAQSQTSETKIAFLADIHFQDLYGNLSDSNYLGIKNPENGKSVLLRTMESQLHSTRIFNENYFALFTALDDIANRGIKIVALPGDYTDDGQPLHVRGLKKILSDYSEKHGIQFFITTGNHDPAGPFSQHSGKDDFLGEGGKQQPIYSEFIENVASKNTHELIISKDLAKLGYQEIMETMRPFGFYPKKEDLFWASPFSTYSPENYTFEIAQSEAFLEKRNYETAPGYSIPDASYVVEAIEGLWLLAIDGNSYPLKEDTNAHKNDASHFKGADLGYKNLNSKKHLVPWIKKIVTEAKKRNKTLIAFSHYPMCDFNDGASATIAAFMGPKKWQLQRVPPTEISDQLADTGLKIHFGGHMHINDTGIHTSKSGQTLVNIQTPSLAAFVPAYKIATIKSPELIEVETVVVKNVPRFDELFSLYEIELNHLQKNNPSTLWNKNILKTKNYLEFTDWHLSELVRMRFLPEDWSTDFANFLKEKTGWELAIMAKQPELSSAFKKNKKTLKSFTGSDLITDFYRLRSGDALAKNQIDKNRLNTYFLLAEAFSSKKDNETEQQQKCRQFFTILGKFLNGLPSDHFYVDLKSGKVFETIIK